MGWRLNVIFAIVAASAEFGKKMNWTRYGAEHVLAVSEFVDKAEKFVPEEFKEKMTEKFDIVWNGTKNEFLILVNKMKNLTRMPDLKNRTLNTFTLPWKETNLNDYIPQNNHIPQNNPQKNSSGQIKRVFHKNETGN